MNWLEKLLVRFGVIAPRHSIQVMIEIDSDTGMAEVILTFPNPVERHKARLINLNYPVMANNRPNVIGLRLPVTTVVPKEKGREYIYKLLDEIGVMHGPAVGL